MKNVWIFIFSLFALSACNNTSSKSTQTTPPLKHVFLLMGQSNMAGYAKELPQDTVPVDRVWNIPTLCTAPFEWQPAKHPLHNRLPASDHFGLGLPFAKEYLKTQPNNVEVGLISVAYGGAPIDSLNKGTRVYKDALEKAKFAIKQGAVIKGVLWHQGESDTVEDSLANSYGKKLAQLIQDIRTDLHSPSLPFIVGDLAEFYPNLEGRNKKNIQIVREALKEIPQKVNHTAFVPTTGCKSYDQYNVHFNRASYILLGKRYAEMYNKKCD